MNWLTNLLGGKPSKNDFAKMVLKMTAGSAKNDKPTYDAKAFAIRYFNEAGEETMAMNLSNIYADYCQTPKELRNQLLTNFISADFTEPETLHDAIVNIMARLQPRMFFEVMELNSSPNRQQSDGTDKVVHHYERLAEHFAITLVVDNPTTVYYLSNKTLEQWGTTFEEILPRAITNLTRITPEPFQRLQEGVYYSASGDTHDASRLLVLHRVQACRLKGRPVAFTPNRNTLIITGDNDREGLDRAIAVVYEALKEPRPMPVFPLILDDEKWQLWEVPDDHPCADDLHNLSMVSFGDLYGEQKGLLEKKFESEGKDVFVCPYEIMSPKDSKRYFSFGTWSKGVPTYLPESSQIALVSTAKGKPVVHCMATFKAVHSVMGEYMKRQDFYPTRYFVETFPNKEQLARIKELGEV